LTIELRETEVTTLTANSGNADQLVSSQISMESTEF
jgi:hypothetical protein